MKIYARIILWMLINASVGIGWGYASVVLLGMDADTALLFGVMLGLITGIASSLKMLMPIFDEVEDRMD